MSDKVIPKYQEYFTVGRSPQEIRDLWEWAKGRCNKKAEHDDPYALGVWATIMYLFDNDMTPPQMYKGILSLKNIKRESERPSIADIKCASCPWRLSGIANRGSMSLMQSREWRDLDMPDTFKPHYDNGSNAELTLTENSDDKPCHSE